jgi:hypothetical protein
MRLLRRARLRSRLAQCLPPHSRSKNSRPFCRARQQRAGARLLCQRRMASINYFGGFLRGQSAIELHQYPMVTQSLKGTLAKGTEPGSPGYAAMQGAWDRELIFPIKDSASAALMLIKADCLHTAGIIDEAERQLVHSRARMFLDDANLKNVALPQSRTAYRVAI